MSRDEFDAKCWRAAKKAILALTNDASLPLGAKSIAMTMLSIFAEVEVAIHEGREPS